MSSRSSSGSTLFLIEQLIVVAVFAICAAACVRIMTAAYFNATDSRDVSNAIHVAQSGAESFKAAGGDLEITALIMDGMTESTADSVIAFVFYDKDWQVSTDNDAHYLLRLTARRADVPALELISAELSVERLDGEMLITFPVNVIRQDTG